MRHPAHGEHLRTSDLSLARSEHRVRQDERLVAGERRRGPDHGLPFVCVRQGAADPRRTRRLDRSDRRARVAGGSELGLYPGGHPTPRRPAGRCGFGGDACRWGGDRLSSVGDRHTLDPSLQRSGRCSDGIRLGVDAGSRPTALASGRSRLHPFGPRGLGRPDLDGAGERGAPGGRDPRFERSARPIPAGEARTRNLRGADPLRR